MKKRKTLNINGKLFVITHPLIMGILNATPDSFFKGSAYAQPTALLKAAEKMVKEGAEILDIGGQSTRQQSVLLSIDEEWSRIQEDLKNVRKEFPEILISVDTFQSEIARRSAEEGIDIINDISAGEMDEQMFSVVAGLHLPYVAMHMQETPQTMQLNPHYENVSKEIFDYFVQRIALMEAAGIKDIIIDPGFGFGKTVTHNYQLMKQLEAFQIFDRPLLVGVSRKSMIYKLLETKADEALNGTTVLNVLALQKGTDILRVHDVKEAVECVKLLAYLEEA